MAKRDENIKIHEAPNQRMTGAIVANDTPPQAEVQAAPVTQPVTTPAPDPYADYQAQAQRQYANTLADIRRRRQELEAKYHPDIQRRQKIMKIMALGKLLGQIGQLAGGGRGPVIRDKDPYQINAWNQLQQLKNEQKYYGQQLDAEERAAHKSMQAGLDRLAVEELKAKRNAESIAQRYQMQMNLKMYDRETKLKVLEATEQFKKDYLRAQGEEQRETAKYNYELALKKIAAQGAKEKDVASYKANLDTGYEDVTETVDGLTGAVNTSTKSRRKKSNTDEY